MQEKTKAVKWPCDTCRLAVPIPGGTGCTEINGKRPRPVSGVTFCSSWKTKEKA